MKIVVLAGGTSTERDVSIVSGTGICGALRQKGHQAILVDVFCGQEEVDWEDPFPAEYDVEKAAAYIRGFNLQMAELKKTRKNFFGPNVIDLCKKADFVFLGLHGANGEDGKLQGAFDLMGIPYTGTGYLSSAMAMDKGVTKAMFQMRGVPTPAGKAMKKKDRVETPQELGMDFPVVVKTCCGGSSIGVYIVDNQEDYENKYKPGAVKETCPAPISEELTKRLQEAAVDGYHALEMESYARLDFIVTKDEKIYCLEANTLPGMTPTSLIPQEAAVLGMDYPTLCEELIKVSQKKYA